MMGQCLFKEEKGVLGDLCSAGHVVFVDVTFWNVPESSGMFQRDDYVSQGSIDKPQRQI